MDVKKRVLFVLPTLNAGGAEKVTINILNSLNMDIFDIHLIVIDSRYKNLESSINENIKITYLNISKTRNAFFGVLKQIVTLKPNIIFSSLNRTNMLILMIKLLYPFFKAIIREPSMPSVQLQNRYMSLRAKYIIKLLYPLADKIIAQTKYMKSDIEAVYKVNQNKVIAINNPIDKTYIQNCIDGEKNPFEEFKSRFNFIYVGRLSDEKNPFFLLDSFEKVVQKDNAFHLYIIGDGDLKEDIFKTIKEKQLQNNITMLGFKKNPYPYMKYADAVLLCSKWEGLPNVVLESLHLNTPVISTLSNPILKDLIVEGENGYLVESINENEFCNAILNFQKINNTFLEIKNFDFNNFFLDK